ncbi:MAG: molybdenum cofactor biosynthesis protein MoaE [Rhizobiales bacterium]|nr:molybdenum cofactor biosynthesis protein MoaE [Hyphomicrobiales bacterium]
MARIKVRIQADPFDINVESALMTGANHPNVGALVTFTGYCRNEEGSLSALELDHYPGMAEAEITRIAEEAARRWPLDAVTAIHRHGKLAPGAPIVLVAAASRHRTAAFEAAEFVMDFLKTRAPFWKKEHPADGSEGGWVDAKEADDAALSRWGDASK